MYSFLDNTLFSLEKHARCYFEAPRTTKDNYIIAASFPKSGNTWFRFIVANILKLQLGINVEVNFHTIRQYAPEIRGNRNLQNAIVDHSYPLFLKSHFPYNRYYFPLKSVLLIRDPFKVMPSYYIYLKEEQSLNLPPFKRFIKHWRYGMPAWVNFHKSWYKNHSYILSYELLQKNPHKEIIKMYKCFGVLLEETILNDSIENSNRNKMSFLLKEKGDPMKKNTNYNFVRKKGESRNVPELTQKELEYIETNKKYIFDLYGLT